MVLKASHQNIESELPVETCAASTGDQYNNLAKSALGVETMNSASNIVNEISKTEAAMGLLLLSSPAQESDSDNAPDKYDNFTIVPVDTPRMQDFGLSPENQLYYDIMTMTVTTAVIQ